LEILHTGPLALIQDLGRVGLAHLGVTRSGAADRRSHTLANRLVANPDDRATIEVTLGGFSARVRGGDVDIAVTGADPSPKVGETMFGANSIQHVRDGEVISLGVPQSGLRSYVAVRGGIDVTPVLGSRSYDVLSAIGPLPLEPGDVLPVGEHTEEYPEVTRRRWRRSPNASWNSWWCRGRGTTGSPIPTPWCTPSGWPPTAATE
jgi:biotin-dependent carboxylase-like uncharacterized protein